MKRYFLLLFIFAIPSWAEFKSYEEFAYSTFRKHENTLTVHILPSSYPLDWRKPRNLLFSLIKNEYWFPKTKSLLGHVTAEVNCTVEGKKITEFIGQATPDFDGFKTYVHMGYGFSILNQPSHYADLPLLTTVGKLDDYKKITERYMRLVKKDSMGFMSFKIPASACLKVRDFMVEYTKRTKETKTAGNRYGFGADPSKFEGAGCAPMVQTLFEKASLDNYARYMEKTVFVSEELLGNPPKGKKVGIFKLFFSDEDISVEKKGARRFDFPDPQELYDRLQGIVHNKVKDHYPIIEKQNLNGKNVWYVLLDTTTELAQE